MQAVYGKCKSYWEHSGAVSTADAQGTWLEIAGAKAKAKARTKEDSATTRVPILPNNGDAWQPHP